MSGISSRPQAPSELSPFLRRAERRRRRILWVRLLMLGLLYLSILHWAFPEKFPSLRDGFRTIRSYLPVSPSRAPMDLIVPSGRPPRMANERQGSPVICAPVRTTRSKDVGT